jgi:hypothetical protein
MNYDLRPMLRALQAHTQGIIHSHSDLGQINQTGRCRALGETIRCSIVGSAVRGDFSGYVAHTRNRNIPFPSVDKPQCAAVVGNGGRDEYGEGWDSTITRDSLIALKEAGRENSPAKIIYSGCQIIFFVAGRYQFASFSLHVGTPNGKRGHSRTWLLFLHRIALLFNAPLRAMLNPRPMSRE